MKTNIFKDGSAYATSSCKYRITVVPNQSLPDPLPPIDMWVFIYGETRLLINTEIELEGDIKEAAKALFFEIYRDNAISTSYNSLLKIYHSVENFGLEYLGNTRPDFFNKLNQEFVKLKDLRCFT